MPGPVYRAEPARHLCRVSLDTLDLIYHRASGITHVVAEPVPQILAALERGQADAAEVARRLAATHDIDPREAEPVVAARLAELEAVGLVVRA
ncbi:HPr-rel-A system PqqD family peptide chaperone [Sphingomonas sp. LaA6.9]|uniref:HPr-rel-A system PqqD family peptide chaperone n=1 Tax=Sphingomonas sp. LaA6.9 TaxID=2919914 RepID=UPI001F4F49A6|nr:HPr-rel-A system PqqD family peptide chaperone [Sphingomonas sp. LaA6.9]MCJ8156776.1 HPr-rel-A system PqqD family peptide chaperone [Sphingomonas sp. LaA6.9]